jgi:hypothetical protein
LADESTYRISIQRRILSYLLEHPCAADSPEGVRHWWLRDADEVSQPMVTELLDELVTRGWLLRRGDQRETQIYSLSDQKEDAVTRFVAGGGEI